MNMNASNWWPRVIGANIIAGVIGPDLEPWLLGFLVHMIVTLGLLLLTSPAKRQED